MYEHEISTTGDAAFYLANEVIHEHHGFPVVHRADFGINTVYVELNGTWYRFDVSAVGSEALADDLDHVQPRCL
jgi:hypothetical protein